MNGFLIFVLAMVVGVIAIRFIRNFSQRAINTSLAIALIGAVGMLLFVITNNPPRGSASDPLAIVIGIWLGLAVPIVLVSRERLGIHD